MNFPSFESDNEILNRAYRLACACIEANTIQIKTGALKKYSYCVMAGLDYSTPWTRDSAINVMNAILYFDSNIAKNMLLSVIETKDGKEYIGDQYWDCIIWTLAAYEVYNFTNDIKFLKRAYDISLNTINKLEDDEFDVEKCLFRGPAVYGDGVSAYPDKYHNENMESAIWKWQDSHLEYKFPKGYGLPMFALSTNCLYVKVYETLEQISKIVNDNNNHDFIKKANNIKKSINEKFYNGKSYDYLYKESNHSEGLGLAFAILFDIANANQANSIIENTYITKNGIPCVWPTFDRYKDKGLGRHSGTIWPQVQGYWASAMKKVGRNDLFENELFSLAKNAVRDNQFVEIYHPETGLPYGGIQEAEYAKDYALWKPCDYQTWSATAFINMILTGIFGIKVKNGVLSYNPLLPKGVTKATLRGLIINGKEYDIEV